MRQTKKTVRCPNCHAEIRADAPYCLSCGVKNPKATKPFYKKWWVWAIAACIVIGGIAGGGETEEPVAPDATEPTAIMETVEPPTENAEPVAEEPESETEAEPVAEEPESETEAEPVEEVPDETETGFDLDKANEKVLAISTEARATAAEGVTDAQRDEAVKFIADHYPNYYADNETMEQAMAYGFLLEYAYRDDEASQTYAWLGRDVEQAIKYVYRRYETVEDEATQTNLEQIQEHLEELGLVEQPDQQEVTEPTTETTAPVTQPTEQPAPEPVAPAEPQEEMVWIPASGSKYHRKSSCSGMEGPRQVTKSEAISMGFGPCGRCY